jgi:PPP family 3-phenylpropionic acid transporter
LGRRRRQKLRRTPIHKPPALRLSAFYALYFGILGVLLPYWPLYLESVGFGPGAIGALMAILPATKIVSPAFWGWLADRGGLPLRYIRWTSFLSALSMALLIPHPTNIGWIGSAMVAFGLFWNGPLPLFETVTLAHLKGRGGYGRIRLWGSMGFILSVAAGGSILGSVLPVAFLPEVMVVLLAAQWIVTLIIPPIRAQREALEQPALWRILKRPGVAGFLVAGLLIQVAHGPYYAFYSVLLSDHGFQDATIGQLWALGVFAEIVLFVWMDAFERRLGVRTLFLLAIGSGVLRWLMIGWGIDSFPVILLAQMLHAGTFGLMHTASISLVHQHFQGSHHAKGQAIYSGFCYGLGGAVGSLYAGYFWQAWHPGWVFTTASMISLLAFVIASRSLSGRRVESV